MKANINRFDNERYFLEYNDKSVLIDEPFEWKSLDNSLIRDLKTKGLFKKISNTISFTGGTAYLLYELYKKYRLKIDIYFVSKTFKDGFFKTNYKNKIDLTEFKYENGKVSVRLSGGWIEDRYNTHKSKSVELTTKTTLLNESLPELEPKILKIKKSNLRSVNKIAEADIDSEGVAVGTDGVVYCKRLMFPKLGLFSDDHDITDCHHIVDEYLHIKTKVNEKSDIYLGEQLELLENPDSVDANRATSNNMTYINEGKEEVQLRIILRGRLKIGFDNHRVNEGTNDNVRVKMTYALMKYKYDFSNGELYSPREIIEIKSKIINTRAPWLFDENDMEEFLLSNTINIKLQKQEAISFLLKTEYIDSDNPDGDNGLLRYTFNPYSERDGVVSKGLYYDTLKMSIETIRECGATLHKSYLLKDILERYLKICGVNNISSQLLNIDLRNYIIVSGAALKNEKDAYKDIKLSTEEIIKNIQVLFGAGYSIFNDAFKLEKDNEFFSSDTLDLTNLNVKILSLSLLKEMFFNTIKVGAKKPTLENNKENGYSKNGLPVYAEYSTETQHIVGDLDLTYTFRTDHFGMELIRRKYDKDSKNNDKDLFIIDCRRIGLKTYTPQLKSVLNIIKTKNIYESISVINLNLSIFNILKNNSKFIGACFKYDTILKSLNTVGNNKASIIYNNGIVTKEGVDIKVNELNLPFFDQDLITLNINISNDLYELIEQNQNKILIFNINNKTLKGYLYSIKRNVNEIKIIKV